MRPHGIQISDTSSRQRTTTAAGLLGLLSISILFLSGCAARALQSDYKGYEKRLRRKLQPANVIESGAPE